MLGNTSVALYCPGRSLKPIRFDRVTTAPGRKLLVLGNHDLDRFNQVLPVAVERIALTLFAPGEPPLLLTRFANAGILDAEAPERGRFSIRIAGSPDDFDARASFEKVVIDLATGEVAFADTYSVVGLGGRSRMDPTPEAKAPGVIRWPRSVWNRVSPPR